MKSKQEKQKELLIATNVKIDIFGKVETTNELNEKEHEFSKINSMWAKVIPQTGKLQKQAADTLLSNVSHKILVRYAAGKDITKDMYIMCKGQRFDIKYPPLNPYYSNEWLEIFCEQVVE